MTANLVTSEGNLVTKVVTDSSGLDFSNAQRSDDLFLSPDPPDIREKMQTRSLAEARKQAHPS